jgi:hypothetical protein
MDKHVFLRQFSRSEGNRGVYAVLEQLSSEEHCGKRSFINVS